MTSSRRAAFEGFTLLREPRAGERQGPESTWASRAGPRQLKRPPWFHFGKMLRVFSWLK